MPQLLRSIASIAFAAWLCASCRTELPLPDAGGEKKIVLLGELTAGDSVLIRAGQSSPLTSGGSPPHLIQDLSLHIEDPAGMRAALSGAEDHLSYMLFTIPYSSPQQVQAGMRYRLQGSHPQLGKVAAEVAVPKPFSAILTSSAHTSYNGDSVLSFDIMLTDPAAADARYVVEVVRQALSIYGYFLFDGNEYSITDNRYLYDSLKTAQVPVSERYDTSYSGMYDRQSMYTSDLGSENLGGAPSGRLFRRVFLQGKTFAGGKHRIEILLPRKALYGEFSQHAQTIVQVKSVSADYYDFLKAYEQYDPSMGIGGNASPVKLQGNVEGGFGMVGGVYRWSTSVIY